MIDTYVYKPQTQTIFPCKFGQVPVCPPVGKLVVMSICLNAIIIDTCFEIAHRKKKIKFLNINANAKSVQMLITNGRTITSNQVVCKVVVVVAAAMKR